MYSKQFYLLILFNIGLVCSAQEQYLYKQVDTTKLFVEVYSPKHKDSSKTYSALVFFFGGSWINGNRYHFLNQAKYFSKRGMVCFLVDYRTKNADLFDIDPNKIVASVSSAGEHLAAASALIEDYNVDTKTVFQTDQSLGYLSEISFI
ncbi:alpha/beta hydrolase [Gaetbulibacter sp. M240]|uniref:alpha/beta hydrolase n=1 Tax=Gaetbulibacter sp. M240 TaxID=3126511 RepID=UPI00374FCA23